MFGPCQREPRPLPGLKEIEELTREVNEILDAVEIENRNLLTLTADSDIYTSSIIIQHLTRCVAWKAATIRAMNKRRNKMFRDELVIQVSVNEQIRQYNNKVKETEVPLVYSRCCEYE